MKFLNKSIFEYKELISEINSEINIFFEENRKRTFSQNSIDTFEINKDISINLMLYNDKNNNSENIDKALKQLTREYVINEEIGSKPLLARKNEALMRVIDPRILSKTSSNIPKLKHEISRIKALKGKFDDDVHPIEILFITALPLEFRAIYRRIEYVFKSQNDSIDVILNPDLDNIAYFKEKRKNCYVEGVLVRDNKYVKIAIQFVRRYASLEAQYAISQNIEFYPEIKEAFLIGIAGQMSKNRESLIGDLALSTGFYNSYPSKLEEDISYTDLMPRVNINNFEETIGIPLSEWKPQTLYENRPSISDSSKENEELEIVCGFYVSGASVVRHSKFKEQILNSFKDSIAVEMEASGCYSVLNERGIELKIIKGICDWADEFKNDKWQKYCADIASEFAVDYVINKYGKQLSFYEFYEPL